MDVESEPEVKLEHSVDSCISGAMGGDWVWRISALIRRGRKQSPLSAL